LRVIVVLFSARNISIHSEGGALKYSREVRRNPAGTRTQPPVAAVLRLPGPSKRPSLRRKEPASEPRAIFVPLLELFLFHHPSLHLPAEVLKIHAT
jgi:hypothetical protein